jgi:hypothetical protein
MTVSWPHTFREEESGSFHEQSAEESVWIREGMTKQTGEYYKMTLKHTYIYTMDPEVCQNYSRIWNNKYTKCKEYMEFLKHKILQRCISYSSL